MEIPDQDIIGKIVSLESELARTQADLKIVEQENLHFTIKFFGEIGEEEIREIDRNLAGLRMSAVEVAVKGLGAFPSLQRPSVIWVGVAKEDEYRITALAEQVIEFVRQIGKPEDHRYHAHITIARVKSARNRDALISFVTKNGEIDFGRTKLDTIKLKSSVLTPRGPIYKDIRAYALG
jgi:2'-5' RNA ligase